MVLAVLAETLPAYAFPLDKSVAHATTGVLMLDALPLLTMLPCVPTLKLYWRRKRYGDLAFFGIGFWLASIYHICQMHPEGLTAAQMLGLPGPVWRTLDIVAAQTLLARTLGHAIGAYTQLVSGLANLFFPAALLAYGHVMGGLSLGACSKVLLAIMLATLVAKMAWEGAHTLPKYCPRRGRKVLVCYVAGFAFFILPEIFVGYYWLFHSLWHVMIAIAYHELYLQLEAEEEAEEQEMQEQELRAAAGRGSKAAASGRKAAKAA